MTYTVTIKRQGQVVATLNLDALNGHWACWSAEFKIGARPRRMQLGFAHKKPKIVEWSGFEFEARQN